MPDIRETLNALDKEDAEFYRHVRTEMRRAYIGAFAQLLHASNWSSEDDAFLDLIDIKCAVLFDRAGRFNALAEGAKEPDHEAAETIEEQINNTVVDMYKPKPNVHGQVVQTSQAQEVLNRSMVNTWPNIVAGEPTALKEVATGRVV